MTVDKFMFRKLDHPDMRHIDNSVDRCRHPFAGLLRLLPHGLCGTARLLETFREAFDSHLALAEDLGEGILDWRLVPSEERVDLPEADVTLGVGGWSCGPAGVVEEGVGERLLCCESLCDVDAEESRYHVAALVAEESWYDIFAAADLLEELLLVALRGL
jgi:hypothetical protein